MASDGDAAGKMPGRFWVVFWCGIGALAIGAGLAAATLRLRNSNIWTLTSEQAPWIVTSAVAFVSSAAIVLAALGGAWLGGRSALKTQQALLDQQSQQAEADREAAEARDAVKRARVVADARGERLRAAYAEHIEEVMAIRYLLAKLHTELTQKGITPDASGFLLEITDRQVALSSISARVQLSGPPELLEEAAAFERFLADFVQSVSNSKRGGDPLDLSLLTTQQMGLTLQIWTALKALDDAKDFDLDAFFRGLNENARSPKPADEASAG